MSLKQRKKKDKKEPDRILIAGKPDYERCDNKVVSARYSLLTFLPVVRKSYNANEWIVFFHVVNCNASLILSLMCYLCWLLQCLFFVCHVAVVDDTISKTA